MAACLARVGGLFKEYQIAFIGGQTVAVADGSCLDQVHLAPEGVGQVCLKPHEPVEAVGTARWQEFDEAEPNRSSRCTPYRWQSAAISSFLSAISACMVSSSALSAPVFRTGGGAHMTRDYYGASPG